MAALCAAACAAAQAAPAYLPDPTRPPALLGPQANEAAATAAAPELQSVLISPRRRVAVISGRAVQVGDKVGEARVARITDSEVVLRSGQDTQVLKLFPQIEKRVVHERTGAPGRTWAK